METSPTLGLGQSAHLDLARMATMVEGLHDGNDLSD